MIFVFGSNEAGIHGAGAAKTAVLEHGARMGIGFGHFGNSFAIPTKDFHVQTLPLNKIQWYVNCFRMYADNIAPEETFLVTRIGCGLAGYKDEQIAPMFACAPLNLIIPIQWKGWTYYNGKYHSEGELLC